MSNFEKLTQLLPDIYVDLGAVGSIQVDKDARDKGLVVTVTVRTKAGEVLAQKVYSSPAGTDPLPHHAMIEEMKAKFVTKE